MYSWGRVADVEYHFDASNNTTVISNITDLLRLPLPMHFSTLTVASSGLKLSLWTKTKIKHTSI